MIEGQDIEIETTKGTRVSGTIRLVFEEFIIINDDRFRPKVIEKQDIASVKEKE